MLSKLISLLSGELEPEASDSGPFERRQIAVAVLLLEAMYVDHRVEASQHAAIRRLLRQHFGLPDEMVNELVTLADQRFAEVLDDWEFAEAVRVGFNPAERQEVLTMLWEVAYADGDLAGLEDNFVSRIAEQLELDTEAADAARATAVARAGLLGEGG